MNIIINFLKIIHNGTKDRIVACAYGNYFFSLLENKLQISEQNGDNVNLDDWKFLAGF